MRSNTWTRIRQGLILLPLIFAASPSSSDAQTADCAFTGPPVLSFYRFVGFDPYTFETVVADREGRCEVVTGTDEGTSYNDLEYRYLHNDEGGGTGILIWEGAREQGSSCPKDAGLRLATFEVDSDGAFITPLPLIKKDYCLPVESRTRLHEPSISLAGDRVAFLSNPYPYGDASTQLLVADALDGRSLASGIDMSSATTVLGFSSLNERAAWSPSGQRLYVYGIAEGDGAASEPGGYAYIYELTESVDGWGSKKLVRLDYQGFDGPKIRARAPSASLWDFDGSGAREVLAYTVMVGGFQPTGLEIIDVAASVDATNPVAVSLFPTQLAWPRFTAVVGDRYAPTIYVTDTSNGHGDAIIYEIDPATGRCLPEGDCVQFFPGRESEIRALAGVFSDAPPGASKNQVKALPAILDLILDDGRNEEQTGIR